VISVINDTEDEEEIHEEEIQEEEIFLKPTTS